ncbi:MAG: dihydrolipoyl dehydrogenase [Chloroflexi bacterium]|nr:dihydrolipoyl dehydrogenase [Chloroflexota bacterium]MBU1747304.1 dihydrolipoyl dehydrogenase [Chloroflexota bacterium]MBU1877327.1 dihydrolipoyl dehydrogenase [Chloroflexota bacterium]
MNILHRLKAKTFDLIVIGSGAGMNVAARAVSQGMHVAVIDDGPLGGTCLNRGCIPSKVMLYPADVIRMVQEAEAIGVHATIDRVDYARIMARVWEIVLDGRHEMEQGVAQSDRITFYNTAAAFSGNHTLQVGDEHITAKTIVIASGARPFIPPIEGLEAVGYLTSDTVFDLTEPPKSLLIAGGGYIAVELAHFFSAIGTDVTIIGRNPRLVPHEEPAVSELLQVRMARYCQVHTNHEVVRAEARAEGKVLVARDRASGQLREFAGAEVLIAASRRSNTDILKPERTGVETDEHGWIVVDPLLRTTKSGIWALGDATGRHQFRHTANYEAEVVWTNAFSEHQHAVDEHAIPHAIFSHPQIAGVGLTEAQALAAAGDHHILVGVKKYHDTAKGFAIGEQDGFVKVIVEEGTDRILGAHIIGPHAAILLQPLVYLMNTPEGNYYPLAWAQTIHPALSEVVVGAFGNLRHAGEHEHAHQHHHAAVEEES